MNPAVFSVLSLLFISTTLFSLSSNTEPSAQYGFILEGCSDGYPSPPPYYASLGIIDSAGQTVELFKLGENQSYEWFVPAKNSFMNQTSYIISVSKIYWCDYYRDVSSGANISISKTGDPSNYSDIYSGSGVILDKEDAEPDSEYRLISDSHGKIYSQRQVVNESGVKLSFYPSIPGSERRLVLPILNQSWVLLNLNTGVPDDWPQTLVFGKEVFYQTITDEDLIGLDNKNWSFEMGSPDQTELYQILIESGKKSPKQISSVLDEHDLTLFENTNNQSNKFWIYRGQTKQIGSQFLHHWWRSSHSSFGADRRWLSVSVLSETLDLTKIGSEVLIYPDKDGLSSVFIPYSSPVYARLAGRIKHSNISDDSITRPGTFVMDQIEKDNATYGIAIEGNREPPSWLDMWIYNLSEFFRTLLENIGKQRKG